MVMDELLSVEAQSVTKITYMVMYLEVFVFTKHGQEFIC